MYDVSLLDFSADSYKVEFSLNQKNPVSYINKEDTIFLVLRDQHREIIYFGEGRITHHRDSASIHTYVLELTKKGIQRFRKKEFRSERYELVQLPNAVFIHPVTQKRQTLSISEISGSGISVIIKDFICLDFINIIIWSFGRKFSNDKWFI